MSDVKSIKVEEYSLVDFVMKIQQGIRDGYEVNDTSDDAPIQIGGAFHLIMRESVKPTTILGMTEERSRELSDAFIKEIEKDADKWDNKELGADEAYVETIEPPKEPTLDESLPKEDQVVQTKQTTKRGRK